jgi:uncharacterized membrane protein
MGTSIFIARIFGLCYLILGIGFLFNRKAFQRVMDDFCKNAAIVFYGGLFALVIGLVIVLTHNRWVAQWAVMITIIGWAALIKGIWLVVFPDTVIRFMSVYQKNESLLSFQAFVALALGVVFTFLGFFV